jgi:hypothetical protein
LKARSRETGPYSFHLSSLTIFGKRRWFDSNRGLWEGNTWWLFA